MRRAGFGARRDELESLVVKGYEETVEELLNPESQPDIEYDLMERYLQEYGTEASVDSNRYHWIYRMINTGRPLQEKMALFWHGILCTGHAKVDHGRQMTVTIDLFRRFGLGNYRDLLVGIPRDPAMVFYLDNCMSHKDAVNENYGRELLELFSLGVGMDGQLNYTEEDVKACSRAYTGWSINPPFRPTLTARLIGGSGTTQRTTTTARRPSWARQGAGTAMISSTSSYASLPRPGSSPGICTPSSCPTSPRSPHGRTHRLAT